MFVYNGGKDRQSGRAIARTSANDRANKKPDRSTERQNERNGTRKRTGKRTNVPMYERTLGWMNARTKDRTSERTLRILYVVIIRNTLYTLIYVKRMGNDVHDYVLSTCLKGCRMRTVPFPPPIPPDTHTRRVQGSQEPYVRS